MKVKIFLIVLLLAGILYQASNGGTTEKNYYVSSMGSDNNSGLSAEVPFKTIQKAWDTVKAGDTINIMAGTYKETLELTDKGSSAGYITIQNYGGQRVILDGSGIEAATLIYMSGIRYIKIQGLEICNATGDWAAGIYAEGSGDHIQILNNKIYNINCANPHEAGSNPILIAGTSGTAPISNPVIDNNQVYDCTVGWCEGISLEGNVSQWEITNNTIYNIGNIGIDAQGHWGTCSEEVYDQARSGYIAGNTVSECHSPNEDGAAAGIYIDGAADVVIEKNTVFNTQHGLEVGCEKYGYTADQITVRDNVIYNNTKGGIYFGGYGVKEAGSVTNSAVTNNTCFNNDTEVTGTGELSIEKVNNVIIENNIFCSTNQNILMTNWFSSEYTKNVTMNYNNWYSPGGIDTAQFVWLNEEYDNYKSYASASNNDGNSVFKNPMFLNEAAFDFHLQETSPAKDAGDISFTATSAETDFEGNARIANSRIDCGAFEFQ